VAGYKTAVAGYQTAVAGYQTAVAGYQTACTLCNEPRALLSRQIQTFTTIMVHIAPLPCSLARQPCPAALPGSLVPAALPGSLAEILQY
jgi:hypothetical protein